MKLLINLLAIAVLQILIHQVSTTLFAARESKKPEAISKHPWLVSVQRNDVHVCEGGVLSDKLVLTASSCIEVRVLSELKVRAGSEEVYLGGSLHKVVAATRNKNYTMFTRPSVHNLALLRVSPPFELEKNVAKVGLPTSGFVLDYGNIVNIFSWSLTKTMRRTTLRIVNNCAGKFSQEQICAAPTMEDVIDCEGYVGGPMIVNDLLVGVLTEGSECGTDNVPKVYTRVAHYRGWLNRSIDSLNALRL